MTLGTYFFRMATACYYHTLSFCKAYVEESLEDFVYLIPTLFTTQQCYCGEKKRLVMSLRFPRGPEPHTAMTYSPTYKGS